MSNTNTNDWRDDFILNLVHEGTMLPAGKTINAGMFPEAQKEYDTHIAANYVAKGELQERLAAERAAAVEDAVTHIAAAKTEGLFDHGDLFIKRAPAEQACIDLIGYEKYKVIKESLFVADFITNSREEGKT